MRTGWGQKFCTVRWLLVTVVSIGLILNTARPAHAVDSVPPDAVTVEASPAGSATLGAAVTFTARVDSSSKYIACSPDISGCPTDVTYSGSVRFIFTMGATTTMSPDVPLTSYDDPKYGGAGNGIATYQVSNLAVGTTRVTVHYNGRSDGVVAPADSTPLDYTITGATGPTASTTSLVATAGGTSAPPASMLTVSAGTNVTFAATVATSNAPGATPTGVVQFLDGATVIGSGSLSGGQVSFSTTALTSGSHSITAMYLGDATYAVSTSSPAVTVTVAASLTGTTTTLTASPNPANTTQPFTLTATVTATTGGPPVTTGSVTFSENGTTLATVNVDGNGVAAYTSTGAFTAGAHTVLATYSGDATYAASNTSIMFTVVIATVSTTGGAAPASISSNFGLALTVNVTAPGRTITGVSVNLSAIGLGTVPLTSVSGSARWRTVATIPANAPVGGPYSLPVTLTDSTNATFSGTPLTVTIIQEVQSISITPGSDARIIAGSAQPFALTAMYTNGTSAPVTTGVAWAVSDTGIATVDGSGRVVAVAAGTTMLTATYSGRSTRVTVTVIAGGKPIVPPIVSTPVRNPAPHVSAPTPTGGTRPDPAPARH